MKELLLQTGIAVMFIAGLGFIISGVLQGIKEKKKYQPLPICKECLYYREITDRCTHNAPIAGVNDSDKWPYVASTESCGQWEEGGKDA